MSLAVGLAWIIIGIVYVVYKFFVEELKLSSFDACLKLFLVIVGIIVIGVLLMTISEFNAGTIILQSIVGIGGCVFLVNVFKWEMEAHKDSVKEEQLPSEVTKDNVAEQARRVCRYSDGSKN